MKIAALFALALAAATPAAAQTVRTEDGVLAGTTADGLAVYKTIPFAAPPGAICIGARPE